jgi:hypothetical protein
MGKRYKGLPKPLLYQASVDYSEFHPFIDNVLTTLRAKGQTRYFLKARQSAADDKLKRDGMKTIG